MSTPTICPGQCNRRYRAAVKWLGGDDVAPWMSMLWAPPCVVAAALTPTLGEPFWCARCAEDLRRSFERIPDVAGGLLAIGAVDVPRPRRPVVGVEFRDPASPRWSTVWAEQLACGHTHLVEADPLQLPARFQLRDCVDCVTASSLGAGRLAPSSRSDRRPQGRPVSPANSPSWIAFDELARWVLDVERRLRAELGHTRGKAVVTTAVAYVLEWWGDFLAQEWSVDAGRQLGPMLSRAERQAGLDEVIRLEMPCPICGRMALQRQDGSDHVTCTRCHRWWSLDGFDRLTTGLAEHARKRA